MSQNINITHSNIFLKIRLRHLYRNRSVTINNSSQHLCNFKVLYTLLDTISHATTWQSKPGSVENKKKPHQTQKTRHSLSLKFHPFFLWTPTAQELSKIIFLILSYKYYDSKFSLFFFMVPSISSARNRVNDMGNSKVHLVLLCWPKEKLSNYLQDTDWKMKNWSSKFL